MSPGWHALGYPTTSVERASGQHAKDLLVIIEEASGVEDEIWNALYSLKYSKLVAIGNPIRAEGRFVDLIRQADKDREDCIPPNKAVCAIHIPSTESPHAHLEKSPYGLADHTWLEACYRHYGSKSLWVGSHIDARIPELSADVLMSKAPFQARVGRAWNDRAGLPGFLRENGGLNPVRRTDLGGREIRQEGGLGGVIAPVPGIMRLFWAFSSSNPPESPSQEDSSLANMLDTLEARCRSDGPPAGPRSIDPLPGSRSFLTVSAVA